jgi:hypothetical protein
MYNLSTRGLVVDDGRYLDLAEAVGEVNFSHVSGYTMGKILGLISDMLPSFENDDQIVLFIELIRRYKIINDYTTHCFAIIDLLKKKFGKNDRIIIIPVRDEKSEINSGHSVAYELKCYMDVDHFRSVNFVEVLDSFESEIEKYHIVVVDDFVGTGSQFCKFSHKTRSKYGIPISKISLFVIASMGYRKQKIEKYCSTFESIIVLDKSLTTLIGSGIAGNVYQIYDSIEANLSLHPMYRRGYGRSEALITMKRTPNNTLPIFWNKNMKGGKKWPAPFPRF